MLKIWRQPRLWLTLLWAFVLAVGAAGLDWSERTLARRAAAEPLLLLPERELTPDQRRQEETDIAADPAVRSARWLAPADLARQMQRRFDDPRWSDLMPRDEEAWLPWMMQVHPYNPLDRLASIEGFVARRRQQGGWTVLWTGDELRALARTRSQLRMAIGSLLLLAAVAGAGALASLPWPRDERWSLLGWSAVLGALAPVAPMAVVSQAGVAIDERTLLIGAATGLILAVGVAPVLRQREKARYSLTIREAPNER